VILLDEIYTRLGGLAIREKYITLRLHSTRGLKRGYKISRRYMLSFQIWAWDSVR
jgi:hypothetical protein